MKLSGFVLEFGRKPVAGFELEEEVVSGSLRRGVALPKGNEGGVNLGERGSWGGVRSSGGRENCGRDVL